MASLQLMGQQVRIRVTAADINQLEAEVRRRGGLFVPWMEESNAVTPQLTLKPATSRDFPPWIVRADDLGLIQRDYIPAQRYWVVDQLRCPLVEWSHEARAGGEPSAGRLFYRTGFYTTEGQWTRFSKDFLDWATAFLGWVRRTYTYDRAQACYWGPSAAQIGPGPAGKADRRATG